jgi:hypothetical protein
MLNHLVILMLCPYHMGNRQKLSFILLVILRYP